MLAPNRWRLCRRLFLRLAWLLSVPAAVACSDAPTTLEAGGTGGSCDPPTTDDDNTVANFEDGFDSVLQRGTPPRNGRFYAYNDELAGCMETPAAHAPLPAATEIEDGGRCGSRYALRFFGAGCTVYAGVGADLAAPLPVDGGGDGPDAATVTEKYPYDLSGYRQITFWGRTGPQAVPSEQVVRFKLPMLVDTNVSDGGTCVDSPTARCGDSYGRFLPFTPTRTFYAIDLVARFPAGCGGAATGTCPEGWGRLFTWDPTNVVSLQFQVPASAKFDIWIDDISLVP